MQSIPSDGAADLIRHHLAVSLVLALRSTRIRHERAVAVLAGEVVPAFFVY
jgi:hypothetical protein